MQQVRREGQLGALLQVLLIDVMDLLIVSDDQICVIAKVTLEHALLLQRDLLLEG